MPEGDWLKIISERVFQAIGNQPLISSELRWPSIAGFDLAGATLIDVATYGKHLFLRFDDARTLHIHLRMDGLIRIARTGSREARGNDPAVRALLTTAHWTIIGLQLGMMDLVRTADELKLIQGLGPDVLAPDFDTAPAGGSPLDGRLYPWLGTAMEAGITEGTQRLMRQPDRPLCQALLDQRIVAGLGTIWMAETLWNAKLYPWRTVSSLEPHQPEALLRLSARLIRQSVTVARTAGLEGVPRRAHGQLHKPCLRCKTQIALGSTSYDPWDSPTRGGDSRGRGKLIPDRMADGGVQDRVVFWCPYCQARDQQSRS
jgi:endonuclease-8